MPLIKMNLPSGSIRELDMWKFACLEINMDTPFILELGLVALSAVQYI